MSAPITTPASGATPVRGGAAMAGASASAPQVRRSSSAPFARQHLELLAELFVERDLDGAACAGQPSIFDAGEKGGMPLAQARALCQKCPVQAACARLGDGPDGRFGYWAGKPAKLRQEKRMRVAGPAMVEEYARLVARASEHSGLGGCTSWHLRATAVWVTAVAANRYLSALSRAGRITTRGERWTSPEGWTYQVFYPTETLLPAAASSATGIEVAA